MFCRFNIKVYVCSAVIAGKARLGVLTDYKGGEDDNSPNDVGSIRESADGTNAFGSRKPVVVSHRHP